MNLRSKFFVPSLLVRSRGAFASGAFLAMVLLAPFPGCTSTKNKEKEAEHQASSAGRIEMASQLVGSGEFKKAITVLYPLSKEMPQNEQVRMLLGSAYLGGGHIDAASREYRTVTLINERNYDATLNYGYTLILKKKFGEARKAFDSIFEAAMYPYMEKVHINYGLSYLEEKRCDLASKHFSQALQLDPTQVSAHFNLGKCHLISGKYKAATESLKKSVDFCPGCIEPNIELARAFYLGGQKKIAVKRLERLLAEKLDPTSEARTRKLLNDFRR